MTYSVSYSDELTDVAKERREPGLTRIETYLTEDEALNRACRLLNEGTHHAISVLDSSGNALCAVEIGSFFGIRTGRRGKCPWRRSTRTRAASRNSIADPRSPPVYPGHR